MSTGGTNGVILLAALGSDNNLNLNLTTQRTLSGPLCFSFLYKYSQP